MHAVVYGTRIARPARASESLGSSVKTDANGLIAPIRGEADRKRYITGRSAIPRSDNAGNSLSRGRSDCSFRLTTPFTALSARAFRSSLAGSCSRRDPFPLAIPLGAPLEFQIPCPTGVCNRADCRILSIRLIPGREMALGTKPEGAPRAFSAGARNAVPRRAYRAATGSRREHLRVLFQHNYDNMEIHDSNPSRDGILITARILGHTSSE